MFLARKSWWGARLNPLDVLLLTDRNERVINKRNYQPSFLYNFFLLTCGCACGKQHIMNKVNSDTSYMYISLVSSSRFKTSSNCILYTLNVSIVIVSCKMYNSFEFHKDYKLGIKNNFESNYQYVLICYVFIRCFVFV